MKLSPADVGRCPFLRAVAAGDEERARRLADLPDEPAVADQLVEWGRLAVDGQDVPLVAIGPHP